MNLRSLTKARLNRKIFAAALAGGILCALVPRIAAEASSTPDEWDEVFDTARAVLARMPDSGRIDTLKDSGLRDAVHRAYRALKACAKVNKGQSSSQKRAFVAEFEAAFKAVLTEAERGEFRDCSSACVTDGSKCERECQDGKKKVCGCKMTQFGCVMKCLFG